MQENLHDGHRERLTDKFIKFPDSFSDHELLEIFLFTVVPRKDTNLLAHSLIKAFGGIKQVFSADAEQLMAINGVGKAIAAQIVLHGKLMRKIMQTRPNGENAFSSLYNIKQEITALFDGVKVEKFYFFLLNGKHERIFTLEYMGKTEENVYANTEEMAYAMSVNKARFAIIAHNHPSGNVEPSIEDDKATSRIYYMCELHGIRLIDHIIVSGKKTYSYYLEKRLDYLRERIRSDDNI